MFLASLQLCPTHLGAKAEARHTQEQSSWSHSVCGDMEEESHQPHLWRQKQRPSVIETVQSTTDNCLTLLGSLSELS